MKSKGCPRMQIQSIRWKHIQDFFLPFSDDVHFMEALKVENCETPRSHQSSTVPDAMRYANFVPSATDTDDIAE